jgi:hypothetical protein
VLVNNKHLLSLLCSYGGHRNLHGRPCDPSMGGRLWPWSPWKLRTVCLPMISLANGGGSQNWHSLGALSLKMALLSTLKACLWVWTEPWGSLLEN